MWLFIETTRPDAFTVGLLGAKSPKLWQVLARSHAVLNEIMKHLSVQQLKKLDGICVVSGPGSFTSTRTGVIVANILSRQFRLPLVGVGLDEAKDLVELSARLIAREVAEVGYVAPVYSSEPNITLQTC